MPIDLKRASNNLDLSCSNLRNFLGLLVICTIAVTYSRLEKVTVASHISHPVYFQSLNILSPCQFCISTQLDMDDLEKWSFPVVYETQQILHRCKHCNHGVVSFLINNDICGL